MATYAATQNGEKLPSSKIAIPEDYDSHDAFLNEMRLRYDAGVSFDQHNIEAGREDAKFVVGNQWDPEVEQARINAGKPALTFNYLVAFVAQLVGNKLLNETEIKVFPDKGGTKEIAQIREGLIRSIFKNSNADLARDEAQKYQVIGGRGVFCLSREYAGKDVFEQDLKLKQVQDPYSVVADPMSIDPTWGDAEWIFVSEDVTQTEFKKRWPKAPMVDFGSSVRTWDRWGYWTQEDTVRIVAYWRMVTEGTIVLGLMQDGTTQDITDYEEFEYPALGLAVHPQTGQWYIREVPNTFARLYICSGNQILEGPYDYQCSSIPVFCVAGWQVNDGERNHRWGMVRFLKDPQRLHNYFRSVQAEALVAAPRNKYMVDPAAVQGYEKRWRDAAVSDDPFLPYNSDLPKPEPVQPPAIDQALMAQAELAHQDMREISNMHEASFGQQSNEVSGRALQQRQNMSDLGTFNYLDRQRLADERCARVINELIPYVYDTARIVMIMGANGKTEQVPINVIGRQETDITLGKYGITVTTGPATATKRQQAADQIMAFVNSVPQIAPLVMDLLVKYLDWPGADELEKRLQLALPPGAISEDEMTPEMKAQQAQAQQLAEAQQQLAYSQAEAETQKTLAEARKAEAGAQQALALAYKAVLDANSRAQDVQSKSIERDVKMVSDALDQHNSLEAEDRAFAAEREDAQTERAAKDREFAAGREDARNNRQNGEQTE